MKERHTKLLEYLTAHGKTEVSTLARYLNTSEVTIRKDLSFLSGLGILRRQRGYALLDDPADINYRMAFHFESKQKIAEKAAACVSDGETLIVESGSTCALFAAELARTKQNVTIITNSMYLAGYVQKYPGIQIVLLGGTLQKSGQSLVGPLTKTAARTFHVDKIFTGTDGYSRDTGFTGDDLIRSDTLHTMTSCANRTYVLAGSEKFGQPGSVSFLALKNVYAVITDSGIPPAEKEFLQDSGILVITA